MPIDFVYLDHAATTPLRAQARDAMAPYLDERYGNPSSVHRWGRQARNALEEARERVAAALGARRREIVFTGGGTEADNLAVLGRWRSVCRTEPAASVVCSAIEHKAVSAAAHCAADEGATLVVLGVDEAGRVDPLAVSEALAARPCVVSVMWANNEIGTIQPVAEIGRRCREASVVFHTDAVQAFGKIRINVSDTPCDLLSISAHKIGGPKGIGALYIRESTALHPLVHGGGQERELRPGTENVAAAVGFAAAAELAVAEQVNNATRLSALRDRLAAGLLQHAPDLIINGAPAERLPNILNVSVPGADQEGIVIGLDLEGVAASGASACQSGTVKPSHVLAAMGRARMGDASVRFSLGLSTLEAEIDFAIAAFGRVIEQIRIAA